MNFKGLNTMDIRAALTDMDGVLYDSMPYHARAWVRMLAQEGITAPYEEFFALEGMTGEAVINLIMQREKGRPATEAEIKRLYRRKTELFVAQGRKQVMAGAPTVLEALVARKILCVLVTGSGQESLIESIERDFPGVFSRERMVTANDVTRGKPDPEPYQRGMEKALLALPDLSPTQVIVIENAPLGVQSAKGAGLFTVGVATGPLPQSVLTEAGADITFPSMTALAEALRQPCILP